MANVPTHGYEALLDLSIALLDGLESENPMPLVTQTLRTALRADIGVCVQVAWADYTVNLLADMPEQPSVNSIELLGPQCLPHYPLARHYARTHDFTPLASNQVDTAGAFARTRAYTLWRSALGVDAQLAVPLPSRPGVFRGFIYARASGSFTDRDLVLTTRLQPVVMRLDRHISELQRLRARIPPSTGHLVSQAAAGCGITPRELTVLALLSNGLTAGAISRSLTISVHTVNRHLENIYRKLGTHDRLATVLIAREAGLLPGETTSAEPATRQQPPH